MAVATQSVRATFRSLIGALAGAGLLALLNTHAFAVDPAAAKGQVSGLPVPRFVSLKADRVNVRTGPNKDQDVRWVYTRAGMPVEITAEFENWRRVRDWEGAEGWVYHSLLSGRRTAVVVPALEHDLVPLYESPDASSSLVARLQGGVFGTLQSCSGTWCEFSGNGFAGWIRQERLWGAYLNETVE